MFKVGDKVKWSSQAQGSWRTKTGTVVEVVSPGNLPTRERFVSLYTGAGCGSPRKHESYVVEVYANPEKKTGRSFYWPLANKLRIVTEG